MKRSNSRGNQINQFPLNQRLLTYLSSCTLNLGVVPLLRFSAFLFLPIFVFLRLLLFSVTRVLETMSSLLKYPTEAWRTPLHYNKPQVLSFYTSNVKALLLFMVILLPNKAFSSLEAEYTQTIVLARGEHRELSLRNIESFTNGNPQVLGHTENKNAQTLLIKGKSIGHSELITWGVNGFSRKYTVYVLRKDRHLKLFQIVRSLEALKLNAKVEGDKIKVTGIVDNLQDYSRLHKIIKNEKANLDIHATLNTKLKNKIIAKIYRRFFSEHVDQIVCKTKNLSIRCEFAKNPNISKEIIQELKDLYSVDFTIIRNHEDMKNYQFKIKLVQFEQLDGRELSLGLSQLDTELSALFENGVKSLVDANRITLRKNNIKLSSLAEPESIVQNGQKTQIKIGSEIPYTVTSTQGSSQTQWKFAGLKIKVQLKKRGNAIQLDYETSFTQPDQSNFVSGNSEKSRVIVPLNTPIPLFQVSFKTQMKGQQKLPGLGDIPILGKIFQSTNHQSNYKNITGVIQVEEYKL